MRYKKNVYGQSMFLLLLYRLLCASIDSTSYVYEMNLKKEFALRRKEAEIEIASFKNKKDSFKVCTYIFCFDSGLKKHEEEFKDFNLDDETGTSYNINVFPDVYSSKPKIFRFYLYPPFSSNYPFSSVLFTDLLKLQNGDVEDIRCPSFKTIALFVYTYYLHSLIVSCELNNSLGGCGILSHIQKSKFRLSYYLYLKKTIQIYSSFSDNFTAFKETLKVLVVNPFYGINFSVKKFIDCITEDNVYDIGDYEPFGDALDELIEVFPLEKMHFYNDLKNIFNGDIEKKVINKEGLQHERQRCTMI